MKKLMEIALGIVTSVGGFLEIGSIATEAQAGAEFSLQLYAAFERLAALSLARAVLRVFGIRKRSGGYRVPWDKLDLSDPKTPRLLCSVSELLTIDD